MKRWKRTLFSLFRCWWSCLLPTAWWLSSADLLILNIPFGWFMLMCGILLIRRRSLILFPTTSNPMSAWISRCRVNMTKTWICIVCHVVLSVRISRGLRYVRRMVCGLLVNLLLAVTPTFKMMIWKPLSISLKPIPISSGGTMQSSSGASMRAVMRVAVRRTHELNYSQN